MRIAIIFFCFVFFTKFTFAKTINIISTPETSIALSEVLVEYTKSSKNNVNVHFTQSNNLLNEIQEGIAVDILITSHYDWITKLKQKGLIDITSIKNLFNDKLVIVSNVRENKFDDFTIKDIKQNLLYNKNFRLIIPKKNEIHSRKYIDMFLATLSLPRWVFNYTIETSDNIEKTLIENPNYLAISFYSQAYDIDNLKIITDIDNRNHEPIIFQAALVASENYKLAEDLLKFLTLKKSKNIFQKNGFTF